MTTLQGRRDSKGFHGRARLEHIGDGTVTEAGTGEITAIIRVISRLVDHCQHFTGGHIQYHRRTAFGLMTMHRSLQFAVGQILHPPVDAEPQIITGARLTDALHILDNTPEAIPDHAFATRCSAQPLVHHQLNPFLARIIDIGKTDHMRGHLTHRIVTAVLLLQRHTRYLQSHHLFSQFRLDVSTQVDEFPIPALGELLFEFIERQFQ